MPKILFAYFLFTSFLLGQSELNNRFNLAKEYEGNRSLEKASQIYLELYNQDKNNPQFFDALFNVNERMQNYNICISLLDEKLVRYSNDINSLGKMGGILIKMGEREKAFQVWNKSLLIESPNAINFRIIADYMIQNRAYDEAIDVLKAGREKGNNDDMFSRDIAHLYAVTMRFSESAKEYCDFILKDPNRLNFVASQVQSYLNNESANEQFTSTVKDYYKEHKKVQVVQFLIHILTYSGYYSEAFEYVKDFDQMTDNNGEKLLQFAEEASASKSYSVAAKAYKYIIDEINNISLLPQAYLGYVRSQEYSMQLQSNKITSWEYSSKTDASGLDQARKLIEDYLHVESLFKRADISNEIFYRVGSLYKEKLKDNELAMEYFNYSINKIENSKYSLLAKEKIGNIFIEKGELAKAKDVFSLLVNSPQDRGEITNRQKLSLGKIYYWEYNFPKAIKLLNEVVDDRSDDIANDAIELSILLTAGQKDSVNLAKLAEADYDFEKSDFQSALSIYKALFESEGLFLLNSYAGIKYCESLLMMNDEITALEALGNISDNIEGLFADKALFLLAQTFQYSLLDYKSAAKTYEKILDKFPSSIYLDQARDNLLYLTSKESNN